MLVTLHEMCKVPFRLLGRNGFHLTAESERFTSAGSRYRQSLKFEKIHSCPLTDFVKKIAPKSVPHVQQVYFSSFNQSYY